MAPAASNNANDVSCVATIKHECCSSIVFCIPEVAPPNVADLSYVVGTIKRIHTLSTESCFVVLSKTL